MIEIIGEAANHVSGEVQRNHPEVPWHEMIGTRHRITHGYFETDLDTLWQVLTVDIPAVVPRIRTVLDSISED